MTDLLITGLDKDTQEQFTATWNYDNQMLEDYSWMGLGLTRMVYSACENWEGELEFFSCNGFMVTIQEVNEDAILEDVVEEITEMATITKYNRKEFSLYVTTTPYELPRNEDGFYDLAVDQGSYEQVGLSESETAYISKSEPVILAESFDDFYVADTGYSIGDDYTTIEVTDTEIIYTLK